VYLKILEAMNMDQEHSANKSCSICNQTFKSDGELQEHKRTAHSQDANKQEATREIDQPDQGDQKRQRIA
jgi:hypothetical protein